LTAIWRNDGTGWTLLAPEGFPDEAALHSLIENAPQLLPLAGSPRLTIVGREVALGSGYADLIGIEPSGRLVLIEVKLAKNAEARRAIVAQVLAYAAYLKGMDIATLVGPVLGKHLVERGFDNLIAAAEAALEGQRLDTIAFMEGMRESLDQGRVRLVLVLDDAPEELVRLVGYLESVTDGLIIDLVTVASFQVSGSQIIVPQRVDPEHVEKQVGDSTRVSEDSQRLSEGAGEFIASIDSAPPEQQSALRKLADWAQSLERERLVRLQTYRGKTGGVTLLPRLRADNAGLVTISHDSSGGCLWFWRSVFERRAPVSLSRVEAAVSPSVVGQGNVVRESSDELLRTLTEAYREAALGRVSG
jgi:hypothetical protein